MELGKKIILNTSKAHKESTQAGKLVIAKHAESLLQKLRDYNIDLFGRGPAQNRTTGKAMDYRMAKDLLIAPLLGNDRYIQFVEDCLVNGRVGVFDPIKKLKLKTGLSEKMKQQKVSIVKEDCQASGEYLSKSIKFGNALQYPLALVLLSNAPSDGALQPSQKYLLRP